ncbi:hypothetical protein GQ44DRAFT_714813 [Phaeosphaeriaceae sp. PMI808]|nr:hypothetical protein GQ44DRAFT_714813 [Phaeosphaeriaceae sp. PMI808]
MRISICKDHRASAVTNHAIHAAGFNLEPIMQMALPNNFTMLYIIPLCQDSKRM